jgi:hypothetical protein
MLNSLKWITNQTSLSEYMKNLRPSTASINGYLTKFSYESYETRMVNVISQMSSKLYDPLKENFVVI